TCAYLTDSYSVFLDVGSTNSFRSNDLHRFKECREWLKKVLYYSLDSDFYCADVSQMLSTFRWFNDQRGDDERGALAVLYFLVKTNRCPRATAYYDTATIPGGWRDIYSKWHDTISDGNMTPFDSTLPSLEDLDLSILRGQSSVHSDFAAHRSAIASLIASDNPFTEETRLQIEVNESLFLKLEIFDILGNKVYSDAKYCDSGEISWPIEGKDLPRGMLYARVSTISGEVQTIKLRHK
ncbi:MAG: hypothetical protein Q8896_12660, partial [Bacteroidota bacterium]|nr:hypothetical protein [Bacteroidota bacterium]